MKTQRLTKFILGLAFTIFIVGKASAQFNDFHNYPYTTTPSEKKDSTRGHVWGYTFGSAYDKMHADSINPSGKSATNASSPLPGVKTGATQYSGVPTNFTAVSFQRIYLGYDYFFNNKFSIHMVLAHEELYDANISKDDIDNANNRTVFIKYCNFEWDNIFKGSNLIVGATVTPGFPITEEPFWGYRSLERTIMDMRGIVSSNDVGVNLGGKFWSDKDASGKEKACIGYNIMYGNGTNAVPDNINLSSVTGDFHRFYGDLYGRFMGDKILIDLYSDYHVVDPNQNDLVWRGLIGYKVKNFDLSFEYFQESMSKQDFITKGPDYSGTGTDSLSRTQSGISIEGAYTFLRDKHTHDPKLGVVARYDMYNPDDNFNASDTYKSSSFPYTEQFMMLALDYTPIKQIHIMPNIWYDGFSNATTGAVDRNASDYDFVARITFYFLFYKN